MEEGQEEYYGSDFGQPDIRVRSLEEKQRILKDRILLIGQNLIETKQEQKEEILDLKKDMEVIKQDLVEVKTFLENISNEISKFARVEDLEILKKQAKMFQPLKLIKN